jgi:hypothetical protein
MSRGLVLWLMGLIQGRNLIAMKRRIPQRELWLSRSETEWAPLGPV